MDEEIIEPYSAEHIGYPSALAFIGENLGYVIVNRHGAVVSYVHWPKPEGVKWPESWHVICRLVPVEE